jgi:CheY-like chemotaxis protein
MLNIGRMEKIKILVVEDEAPIQELLQFNLERKKYRVKVVDSGEEALKLTGQYKPDLILLDIMLPGADGLEVCKQLKANPIRRFLFWLKSRRIKLRSTSKTRASVSNTSIWTDCLSAFTGWTPPAAARWAGPALGFPLSSTSFRPTMLRFRSKAKWVQGVPSSLLFRLRRPDRLPSNCCI